MGRFKKLSCESGFTLVETTISVACLLAMMYIGAEITSQARTSQVRTLGKLDGIQQRSEIKDAIFSSKNTGTSCIASLGITGNQVFTPGVDYQLVPQNFNKPNSTVRIDKIYLREAVDAGAEGLNRRYSTRLRVEQSLSGSVVQSLAPIDLGTVKVVVDSSNKIVSCNWDVKVTNSCPVTGSSGTTCYMPPTLPTIASCPAGTALNPVDGHCIPSNVNCYNQNISNGFDGNLLNCQPLAPSYVITYPTGFTPPTAPATMTQPTSVNQTTTTTQTTTATPATGPNVKASCACGSGSIPANGTQLCIQAYNAAEPMGNFDDMWDVQVCNSAGQLQPANPAHVFNEDGQGVSSSWALGSCVYFGGYKSANGILFANGKCG